MLLRAVLLVLASLGALYLVDWFLSRVSAPPGTVRCLTVLPLRGRCEQIEAIVRYHYGSMRWSRWLSGGFLALVDLGADEETLRIAGTFCEGKSGIELCPPERLRELVGDSTVYKCLRIVLY